MAKIFIAVLVTCIAMIVVFQIIDPNINNQTTAALVTTSTSKNANTLSVTITGEITRSGTYLLSLNTTLGDLIDTAQGVTSNADEDAYDTSYQLVDGYSFYIAPKYDNTDVCSLEPISKVNINEDDADTLQEINGFGATVSKALVTYREANGDFTRIEDIKNVNGIGNATFEKVKNYITLR